MVKLLLFICFLFETLFVTSQIDYAWNGSSSTNWNTATNWTPNGIPGASDDVTIFTGLNNCILASNTTVYNLTISSGTLNLNSFTLTSVGLGTYCDWGRCVNGVLKCLSSSLIFSGTVFDAAITATVSELLFDGGTFNNTVDCTKTGSMVCFGYGGCVFNGPCTFNKTGDGPLLFGFTNPDTFNDDITLSNSDIGDIYLAAESYGNQFNGNIILNSTGLSDGFNFCYDASSSASLAAGKTIQIGTFTSGALRLKRFTQLGNAPMNLVLNPVSICVIDFGPNTSIGGNLTSSSSLLTLNTTTFSGSSNFTTTGTGAGSVGGNIFNGPCVFTVLGGLLTLGITLPDTWNDDVTFNDNGYEGIYVCNNSAGNLFNGNITLNSDGTPGLSDGIGICPSDPAATATLAAGKTITTGTFNNGSIVLSNFTQLGSAAVNLTVTSSVGYGGIRLGPGSCFGGDVTSLSPELELYGCTFAGTTSFTKTGNTTETSGNINIFTGVSNITNASDSGSLIFGEGNVDSFLNNVTVNNTGTTSSIFLANNSSGNAFTGTLSLNNFATGAGQIGLNTNNYTTNYNCDIVLNSNSPGNITFGGLNGAGVLASGKTLAIGSGSFSAGKLALKNFTQTGSTAQNLTQSSGTSTLTLGPASSFDGNVAFTFPELFLNGTTFNGQTTFEKTGTGLNQCIGGNIFNGATTLNNSGSNIIRLACVTSDTYNGNVTFNQMNTLSPIKPNYGTNCPYFGNITVSSQPLNSVTFGSGLTGIATLAGGNAQTINRNGSGNSPTFVNLVIAKSANDVTLNTRVNVSGSLTLTQGIIYTSQLAILNLNNDVNTSIGNANSYVNGPMSHIMAFNGLRTLHFPVGKNGDWRPIVLTANHTTNVSYAYNTEVFVANADALGWTKPPTVNVISQVHYWDVHRINTSSAVISPTADLNGNQNIVLYYDTNDNVSDASNLTICKNTPTASSTWIDIGGTGASVGAGSVSSTSSPSAFDSFSRFTLGNKSGGTNVLPIELLYFTATKSNHEVVLDWATAGEKNNDHFELQRSADGINFERIGQIKSYGNSPIKQIYRFTDEKPYFGLSYYRLKQVDKDLSYTYSTIQAVQFSTPMYLKAYPNPCAGILNIDISAEYFQSVCRIFNSLGIEVLVKRVLTDHHNSISFGDLPKGIYTVVIEGKYDTAPIKISLLK